MCLLHLGTPYCIDWPLVGQRDAGMLCNAQIHGVGCVLAAPSQGAGHRGVPGRWFVWGGWGEFHPVLTAESGAEQPREPCPACPSPAGDAPHAALTPLSQPGDRLCGWRRAGAPTWPGSSASPGHCCSLPISQPAHHPAELGAGPCQGPQTSLGAQPAPPALHEVL